jgi:flagellar hook-length control protein FliK
MPAAPGALQSSPTAADDESAAPVQAFVEHLRDIAAMRQTTLRPGASEAAIAAGLLGAEPRPGPIADVALARVDAAVAATAAGSAVLPGAESRTAPPPAPVSAFAWSPLSTELDRGFGERLVWMAQQGIKTARVRVHPEHLGPIDIRLKLDGDSAQVTLVAPHALARDALEQALPRLREVLGDAGVTLTEAQVDHRGGGAADRHPDETDSDAVAIGASGAAREAAAEETPHRLALVRVGLVDRFA